MRLTALRVAALAAAFLVPTATFAAIPLSTTTAAEQTFNGIGATATAALPADFKADRLSTVRTVGSYPAAGTATTASGGNSLSTSASNGIYNFGAGPAATATDRAIGFLSSGSGTTSGNLYAEYMNATGATITSLQIAYDVEKYRNGSNAQGFTIQLYSSLNGTSWTSAGPAFATSFTQDANNNGFTSAPGTTVPKSGTLSITVPAGGSVYLAWNYSVTALSTVTNAQALAIDNISVLATADPTLAISVNDGQVVEGNGGTTAITFTASLSGPAGASGVSFTVSTADGTANASSDYGAESGTPFTIPSGGSSVTFDVAVNGDTDFEPDETFLVNLGSVTGANVADGQGTGTILNDDVLPSDHVVISQIYGGGGNTGATYHNDYVELYNPSLATFDLTGWTLQYASAAGTSWTNNQPLGGIIAPGEYYLISLASGSSGDGADLPLANIEGSINMSATAGKVALVSNGAPLSGICPLTSPADPDIVDFVGYGTTASCSEGDSDAPGPSSNNTTAAFRKNGGLTDTNNNGDDFVIGAPDPRRTAPIAEVGPSVVSTDPQLNASSAPRDASMTVNFSEPVDVTGAWFNITCVATASHNDATVAGGGTTWVITPNTNFQTGEQCTVTIFKDFVHDQDFDDSAPNTDTLPANYSWTFSVATGTAPAYPSDVHLTMGNPSEAIDDTAVPNNYLMVKPEFALSYNRDRGTPNWVSWHLSDEWVGTLTRVDTFRPDPAVSPDWYRVQAFDYFSSGFDRGHMTPNADRDKETSIPINQATFLMTNMIPQAPDNNQGPWANLENYLRTLLPANEIYIVAGGEGTGGTGFNGPATTIANGHVTVPAQTWKVALVLPKADDDVSRATASTRTIAVVMPNTQGIRSNPNNANDWQNYLVNVDHVETLTGYDFFENVSDAVENSIEAGVNGNNPPGAANQTVSTSEDTPKTFTLEAVSPNNPLTYTILTQPTHGTLTGSGGSRTYTPDLNFYGTDSFTYRVNDGVANSSVATVTINVSAVNDAPVLEPVGNKTVFLGDTLTFTAVATDVDVPAQTLSYSLAGSVPAGAAIVEETGVFTWTPAGTQAGLSFTFDVVVSDGVDSTSTPVTASVVDNTPPELSSLSLSTTQLWPANHKMVNVTVAYTVFDAGDPAPACSLRVSSNEPIDGTGDGDTAPDWQIVDEHHVRLRAERAGSGEGRIYTIVADCTDRFGNLAQSSATVGVPLSQGN